MTEAQFKRLAAQGYNRVPVVLETCADLDTPLSVYLKLANRPNTYLLESVIGGERFGRYSFIGLATRTAVRRPGGLFRLRRRALDRAPACGRLAQGRSARVPRHAAAALGGTRGGRQ